MNGPVRDVPEAPLRADPRKESRRLVASHWLAAQLLSRRWYGRRHLGQRIYDDATGLYYAYDYRGYLWLCDTDSAKTTPEQVFHHDALGNRVLEEGWYDNPGATNMHKTVLVNDIQGGGGCGSNSGEAKAGEVRYNSSDTETSSVQYVYGKGPGNLVHERAYNGSTTVQRYRHEDQAGSLIGVTDEDGFRTDEYFYLDFGTPVHRPILFDGGAGEIESITANTPSAGYTRIGLFDDYLTADVLIGKQLRALGSLHVGEVYDNGTDTIDVVDPTGAIYTAIYGNLNIVVMDFDAPAVEPVATGTWTAVTYDELNEWTVLEDTSASFNTTVSVGDLIQPDTAQPSVVFGGKPLLCRRSAALPLGFPGTPSLRWGLTIVGLLRMPTPAAASA